MSLNKKIKMFRKKKKIMEKELNKIKNEKMNDFINQINCTFSILILFLNTITIKNM